MGKIYYLMGKSASGKDTIYKRLLEECPQIKRVVLYTTRPRRAGETDGVEYHFVDEVQMQRYLDFGSVIEMRTYQTIHGPWSYATVDDGEINLTEHDYLAIGTLESYEKTLAYYGAEIVVPILVTVDDGVRLERALARERQQECPKYAELCRRFLADEEDFAQENLDRLSIKTCYDNTDLAECTAQILREMKR